jgi:hypothetical protein
MTSAESPADGQTRDWTIPEACFYAKVVARIEHIANALALDPCDVPEAVDVEEVIDWAERHGQSLDWIYRGDTTRFQYLVVRPRR